jgi:F0F1-type ATP synthase membrane subunit b/b'
MKLLFFILTMTCAIAFAEGTEEGHAGHEHEIPKVVLWQTINLAIIFGYGYYKFGDKVVALFKERNSLFLREAEKSKQIQQEAEAKLTEIKHKLSLLEGAADESVERARAEAADLRKQLSEEAKQLAERIRREAESAAQVEIQGAKRALYQEVVKESVKQAQDILKKDVGQTDQQRLQDQFSKQIEGVRL